LLPKDGIAKAESRLRGVLGQSCGRDNISRVVGIDAKTLRKHYREELLALQSRSRLSRQIDRRVGYEPDMPAGARARLDFEVASRGGVIVKLVVLTGAESPPKSGLEPRHGTLGRAAPRMLRRAGFRI
jgi:hypothetical protein